MSEPKRFPVPDWVLPLLIIIGLAGLLVWSWPVIYRFLEDPDVLRDSLRSSGPWAPAAFVGLQFLQVVVFVLPGEFTQVTGGWLFGFWGGTALSVLGIALGASVAFALARWLGVGFVHRIAGPTTTEKFDRLMGSPRFTGSLFLLFLMPGVPKDILCYVSGLSRLKFLPFLGISTLARLPGILGSSLLGKALAQEDWILLGLTAAGALGLFALGFWQREPIFRWVERVAMAPAAGNAPKEVEP